MNSGAPDQSPELVIIRRRSPDGADAHKGGVWKIAYADFMTAMMAFFLVMWLINAANEATRAQVASYFNPVKLVDTRTNVKGLQDLDTGGERPAEQKPAGKGEHDKAEGLPLEATKSEHGEEALFQDPYVVLAELAKEAGAGSDTDKQKTGVLPEESGRPGLQGGEGFVDPFDPSSWSDVTEAADPSSRGPASGREAVEKREAALVAEIEAAKAAGKEATPPRDTAGSTVKPAAEAAAGDRPTDAAAPEVRSTADRKALEARADAKPVSERDAKADAGVAALKQEIETAAGEAGPGQAPLVDVRSTEEGVLVSLTDASDFAMFSIASAKPKPELVLFMEKVAKVLSARPGRIVIRGHTDGRPFRSDTYDNWRLSAARAHMAYYMLVRGGIDEARVERIEGHADRQLKVPGNPEADENRRIEILVREEKP